MRREGGAKAGRRRWREGCGNERRRVGEGRDKEERRQRQEERRRRNGGGKEERRMGEGGENKEGSMKDG